MTRYVPTVDATTYAFPSEVEAHIADVIAEAVAAGAGANVTLDGDGSLVVNGVTIELGTDAELASALNALPSTYVALANVTDVTAADIPFTPNGTIAATTVQAAIQEVRDEYPTPTAAYTDEQARDAAAAMLLAGVHSGITVTNNDAGDSLSLVVTGGGGGSGSGLVDNADGTFTLTGTNVTDNGDGTFAVAS